MTPEGGPGPIEEEPLGVETEATIARWLLDHGGAAWQDETLFMSLCQKLQKVGLNLHMASLILGDAHPQVRGRAMRWRPGAELEVVDFPYQREESQEYLRSPIKVIHDGAQAVRQRLDRANAPFDHEIFDDLAAEGATDYVAMALPFTDGSRHFVSWVSARDGGFSTGDLALLDRLMPMIALRIELAHSRRLTKTLLRTYLGTYAAERIESGQIRRSEGETMKAIIVFADLRSFTRMTDTLSPSDLIDVLGTYYEAVTEPLAYFGGDINKLIGDGLLALFPIPEEAAPGRLDRIACGAITGVKHAIERLANIPPTELPVGLDMLNAGFGVHVGDVTFGNVGSRDRLDFTVIGPAVNEASRVQILTKNLERPLLTTAAFAELQCSVELESLGSHVLRGFREPKEIYAVKGV